MINSTVVPVTSVMGVKTNVTWPNMTLRNDDYENPMDDSVIRFIFISLYTIVFCTCFLGNLLMFLVIAFHARMRTITNFFLANLAVTDLCVGIFCVLPNLSSYLWPEWILGRAMCKLYYFVQAMSYTASISILGVISIERYVAIIYPMRSRQLQTMCLLRSTVIGVWTIAAGWGVPYLIVYDTVDVEMAGEGGEGDEGTRKIQFCIMVHDFNAKAYTFASFLIWYFLPLSMMTLVYCRISVVLWRSSRSNTRLKVSAGGDNKYKMADKMTDKMADGAKASKQMLKSVAVEGENNCDGFKIRLGGGGASTGGATGEGGCDGMQPPLSEKSRTEESQSRDPTTETDQWSDYAESDEEWPSKRKPAAPAAPAAEVSIRMDCIRRQARPSTTSSIGLACNTDPRLLTTFKSAAVANCRRTADKSHNALQARRKVIRLLIAVVVSFAVCLLPYHARIIWLAFSDPQLGFWHGLIPPITFLLYYLNSAINPILYAFLSDKFRSSLLDIVRCRDDRRPRRISITTRTFNSVA